MAEFNIVVFAPEPIVVDIGSGSTETDDLGDGGTAGSKLIATADSTIRVDSGSMTSGSMRCGDAITITATAGDTSSTPVAFTGAGTGTPGFDSGSLGQSGERILLEGTHYTCGDTIIIRLTALEAGEVVVVGAGGVLPDPIVGTIPADDGDGDGAPVAAPPGSSVTFRLENATATATNIVVAPQATVEGDDQDDSDTSTTIRVLPGEFSIGAVDCDTTYVVSATIDGDSPSSVLLIGAGTGTPGFDSSSVGANGERFLLFGDHYACGGTIVVRISDDGSGIGLSTSTVASGAITVFGPGVAPPDPELPDLSGSGGAEAVDNVTMRIVNSTEATIQLNIATGNGSLGTSRGEDATSEFDVRVPAGSTTTGTVTCAQEFMIGATHLAQAVDVPDTGDFFGGEPDNAFFQVILTGAGTGTEGFDDGSIAVTRGRLFQLDTHFLCGDTITITITATNNVVEVDEEDNITIIFGIGDGQISVTSDP